MPPKYATKCTLAFPPVISSMGGKIRPVYKFANGNFSNGKFSKNPWKITLHNFKDFSISESILWRQYLEKIFENLHCILSKIFQIFKYVLSNCVFQDKQYKIYFMIIIIIFNINISFLKVKFSNTFCQIVFFKPNITRFILWSSSLFSLSIFPFSNSWKNRHHYF